MTKIRICTPVVYNNTYCINEMIIKPGYSGIFEHNPDELKSIYLYHNGLRFTYSYMNFSGPINFTDTNMCTSHRSMEYNLRCIPV